MAQQQRSRGVKTAGQTAQKQPAVAHQQKLDQSTPLVLKQSLDVVKTLVETSLGCLSYLRGIFPEDNFEDKPLYGSVPSSSRDRGIKVKEIKKGCSAEADTLLEYWEKGVQHALERGYLASFIVALYLDPAEPESIIESYTFSFSYTEVLSENVGLPFPDLIASLENVTITEQDNRRVLPTQRDVRANVQSIIRALITLTQSLCELPRRRFMTLKLLYTDRTPVDYEPPCFVPVDPAKHHFVFTTKSLTKGPDRVKLGTLDTGHHGVALEVASLAHLLPEPTVLPYGPDQDALAAEHLKNEIKAQMHDAEERIVIWDAEEAARCLEDEIADAYQSDSDAEGDPDPAFIASQEELLLEEERRRERKRRKAVGSIRTTIGVPTGIKTKDGRYVPVPPSAALDAKRRENEGVGVDDVEVFVGKALKRAWLGDTNADLANGLQGRAYSHSIAPTVRDDGASMPPLSQQSLLSANEQLSLPPPGQSRNVPHRGTQPVETAPVPSNNSRGFSRGETQTQPESQTQPDFRADALSRPDRTEPEDVKMNDGTGDIDSIASSPYTQRMTRAAASGAGQPDREDSIKSYTARSSPTKVAGSPPLSNASNTVSTKAQQPVPDRSDQRGAKSDAYMQPNPAQVAGPQDQHDGRTRCVCGDPVDDCVMIRCDSCNEWSHAVCYGYETPDDTPAHFTCFKDTFAELMLTNQQQSALGGIKEDLAYLALTRRALDVLYATGLPYDNTRLASRLGTDTRTAGRIRADCLAAGFALPTSTMKGKRKVKGASQTARQLGDSNKELLDLKKRKYFTPSGGRESEILAPLGIAAVDAGLATAPVSDRNKQGQSAEAPLSISQPALPPSRTDGPAGRAQQGPADAPLAEGSQGSASASGPSKRKFEVLEELVGASSEAEAGSGRWADIRPPQGRGRGKASLARAINLVDNEL